MIDRGTIHSFDEVQGTGHDRPRWGGRVSCPSNGARTNGHRRQASLYFSRSTTAVLMMPAQWISDRLKQKKAMLRTDQGVGTMRIASTAALLARIISVACSISSSSCARSKPACSGRNSRIRFHAQDNSAVAAFDLPFLPAPQYSAIIVRVGALNLSHLGPLVWPQRLRRPHSCSGSLPTHRSSLPQI